jgi:hypothetical protein
MDSFGSQLQFTFAAATQQAIDERKQAEDVVAMDFAANCEGNHRPSSEWRFHRETM